MNISFHENPSAGGRVFPFGPVGRKDRQTDRQPMPSFVFANILQAFLKIVFYFFLIVRQSQKNEIK